MAILTRELILAADDIQTEAVPVPEWGGEVLVRGLSGADRDRFEDSITQVRGKKVVVVMANMRARLVSLAIVDEAGKRLFCERDVEALGAKSASALNRVFEAAQRLSGLSNEDMEELAKNLPGGQSGGSGSA